MKKYEIFQVTYESVDSSIDNQSKKKLLRRGLSKRAKVVYDNWLEVKMEDSEFADEKNFGIYEKQLKKYIKGKTLKIDDTDGYFRVCAKLSSTALKLLAAIQHEIVHKMYFVSEYGCYKDIPEVYRYSNVFYMSYRYYQYLCNEYLDVTPMSKQSMSIAMKELVDEGSLVFKQEQDARSYYRFNPLFMYSEDRTTMLRKEMERTGELKPNIKEQAKLNALRTLIDVTRENPDIIVPLVETLGVMED